MLKSDRKKSLQVQNQKALKQRLSLSDKFQNTNANFVQSYLDYQSFIPKQGVCLIIEHRPTTMKKDYSAQSPKKKLPRVNSQHSVLQKQAQKILSQQLDGFVKKYVDYLFQKQIKLSKVKLRRHIGKKYFDRYQCTSPDKMRKAAQQRQLPFDQQLNSRQVKASILQQAKMQFNAMRRKLLKAQLLQYFQKNDFIFAGMSQRLDFSRLKKELTIFSCLGGERMADHEVIGFLNYIQSIYLKDQEL